MTDTNTLLPLPHKKIVFKARNYYGMSWYIGELMYDINDKPFFYTDLTSENGQECVSRMFDLSDVECFAYVEGINFKKCTQL